MVQKIDECSDGQTVANILIERIINEVLKVIQERINPEIGCNSFESLKFQTYQMNENLEYSGLKEGSDCMEKLKASGSEESFLIECNMSEICYRDFPTVASSVSATSKQGEGDFQHPQMREAAAFYCLQPEAEQNKDDDVSSLNTETSHDELIAALKDQINNLSFDNIQLSDSEADDGLQNPIRLDSAGTTTAVVKESGILNDKNIQDELQDNDDFSNTQRVLRQSQKFCHINNKQYFPYDGSELNVGYCQFVGGSQGSECKDEEEQELISRSSEELLTIEGDEDFLYPDTNPFRDSLSSRITIKPSTICLTHNQPDGCSSPESTSCTIKVVADVEPYKEHPSWEESCEDQVNITNSEAERTSVDDGEAIQKRNYWSNVGLMSETKVDPRCVGFVDVSGIESVKNMKTVEIKCLKYNPEEIVCSMGSQELEGNTTKSNNSGGLSDSLMDSKINYLTSPNKFNTINRKEKKKNFISRLAGRISNILRSKKKNSK